METGGFRHSSFVTKSTTLLHGLKAGDVLIDFCSNLPELGQYIARWDEAETGEGSCVPASFAEAQILRQSFRNLLEDIDLTSKALSLPLLEPLTSDRLTRLAKIVMGCLVASVSVATSQSIYDLGEANLSFHAAGQSSDTREGKGNSNVSFASTSTSSSQQNNLTACFRKLSSQSSGGSATALPTTAVQLRQSQLHGYAIEIVEKSLELFNTILAIVRQSTRAGGHILQNFMMMGAWVLVKGLLVQINNTCQVADKKYEVTTVASCTKDKPSKSSDPVHDEIQQEVSDQQKNTCLFLQGAMDLSKAKHGFSVLSVALGSQALTLTSMLFDDLSSEIKGKQ